MNHHDLTTNRGASSILIGPYRFDLVREELSRENRAVHLPPQSARMLALLARHRGQIVSHEEARRAIWGEAVVEFDQGLHTIVKQLRAALGDDARQPTFVQTIPRRGYRLMEAPRPVIDQAPTPSSFRGGIPGRRIARVPVAASFTLLIISFVMLSQMSGGAQATAPQRLGVQREAMTLFLTGLQQLESGDAAGALGSIERALVIDPDSAPILSARARARLRLAREHPELIESARRDALAALRLDPRLIEPRMTLAHLAMTRDRNPSSARRLLEAAVRAAPRDIEPRLALAHCYSAQRNHQRAIEETERAMAIDPLATQTLVDSGWVYFYARRFEDALEFADRALELDSANELAVGLRYECLEKLCRWDEACQVLRALMDRAEVPLAQRPAASPSDPRTFIQQAMRLHLERHSKRGSSPVILAVDCIRLGEPDQAFGHLDDALELDLCSFVPFIGVDPRLDPLRSDERFARMLAESRQPR